MKSIGWTASDILAEDTRATTPLQFVAVFVMATYVANLKGALYACNVPAVCVRIPVLWA